MSEVKVNKISPRTNCGTVQLGDSGDTITIPAGATITNNGTQTGFGRTGAVDWDTTAKTASFTAVSGNGYFVNTTSGAITVTLPATPSAGDIVSIKDYANTFNTNNVTLARNGSNIGGDAIDATLSTQGLSVTLVYVDATKGWLVTDDGLQSQAPTTKFVTATGGTIKTCGNYKTHIFTGPGTFCVSCAGNAQGSNVVEYFVVAGGGSGGGYNSTNQGLGGGGAGGFRLSAGACVPAPTMSPLAACVSALPVTAQGYPITVGAGGARIDVCTQNPAPGQNGSNSIFSTITSTGGGAEGDGTSDQDGSTGGSGGGGGRGNDTRGVGGAGNTPPVSPPQGNPGGNGVPIPVQGPPAPTPSRNGGGGGGASSAGQQGAVSQSGVGGPGSFVADAFIGGCAPSYGEAGPVSSTRYFAGGGGGSGGSGGQPGGLGGGGDGRQGTNGNDGITNSGGGGGGGNNTLTPGGGGNGGSGIVMIRYKFQ
jgi:hypothetical protein